MIQSSKIIVSVGQEDGLPLPLHAFLSHAQRTPAKGLILLLHGAGGDHYHFDAVVHPLVEAGFHVVVPDLRFHGESQPVTAVDPASPVLGVSSMMCDLDHLLEAIRSRFETPAIDLIIGGLSMGGLLSQACAIHRRSTWAHFGYCLKGLIPIACPSVNMAFPRIAWIDMYRNPPQKQTQSVLSLARQYIIASAVHPDARQETARAMALISDIALLQCFRACASAIPPPPPQEEEDNSTPPPQFGTLPPQLPTLLITGDQDEHTVAVMRTWQQLNETNGIPGSRLTVVREAGHMVPLDQPAAVAEAIVGFFVQYNKTG